MQSLVIKMKLTVEQKLIIDRDLHTSNYVYNRTLSYLKSKKYSPKTDKFKLRTLLVTNNTQTEDEKYIAFQTFIKTIRKNHLKNITSEFKKKCKKKKIKLKEIVWFAFKKQKIDKQIEFIKSELQKAKKEIKPKLNELIHDWELETDKDVRAEAVKDVFKAYDTAIANVAARNIRFFNIHYRSKKKFGTAMVYSQQMIKMRKNELYFTSKKMKDKKIHVGNSTKNKLKKLNIQLNHDMRICKKYDKYYLMIPLDVTKNELKKLERIIGIDPGIRVFLSCFTNDSTIEYIHNEKLLDNLDKRIQLFKNLKKIKRFNKKNKKRKKRIRKRKFTKLERKKSNLVDELHWKTINHLLEHNDVILLGKLESQGFVKGGKNKDLNRRTNNIKPYLFRMRLLYKAKVANKTVKIVPEHFTTQTCSNCGSRYKIEDSKIYNCENCKKIFDRDSNSAKNIYMKGILTC